MRDILSAILVVLVIAQSGCHASNERDEREEAAVYRDYIGRHYINRKFVDGRFTEKPFSLIVVSQLTAGFHHPFSYQDIIGGLTPMPDEKTVKDFLNRNDGYVPKSSLTEEAIKVVGRYPLNRYISFSIPHALISDKDIDEIFNRGGRWDEFYRRYPTSRGIVWLSRVGFNQNMSEALLYFGHQYAEAAGEGFLVLLRKSDGEWREVSDVAVWVS